MASEWRGHEHIRSDARFARVCKVHRVTLDERPDFTLECPVGPHVLDVPSSGGDQFLNVDVMPFDVVKVDAPVVDEGPPPPAVPIQQVPAGELEDRMPKGHYDRSKMRRRGLDGVLRPPGEASAPGTAGGSASPTPKKRRGRKPGPKPKRRPADVTSQEFHDVAGSLLVLEVRSSRRVPFGIALTHKQAGKTYAKRGMVEICESKETAQLALANHIEVAVRDGWKLGKLPARLMEIPKPILEPLRKGGPGRGRRGKA